MGLEQKFSSLDSSPSRRLPGTSSERGRDESGAGCDREDALQATRRLTGQLDHAGGRPPDYDVADAFAALCTAVLHAENDSRPVLAPDPTWQERLVKEWEGAIWVPTITTKEANRGDMVPVPKAPLFSGA